MGLGLEDLGVPHTFCVKWNVQKASIKSQQIVNKCSTASLFSSLSSIKISVCWWGNLVGTCSFTITFNANGVWLN